jgi:N-methylhydantoinase B/oxoprolinase/acetone carboxylase alpha subunit
MADEHTVTKINYRLVPRGTIVSARTGGGGGFGLPAERENDLVRDDLIDGYVTSAEIDEPNTGRGA